MIIIIIIMGQANVALARWDLDAKGCLLYSYFDSPHIDQLD